MSDSNKMENSLQFKLALGVSTAILVVTVAAGAISFFSAYYEAIDLQDEQLRHVAALVAAMETKAGTPPVEDDDDEDEESRLVVQYLPPRPGAADENRLTLPPDLPNGFSTRTIDDESWRLFATGLKEDERLVVAQPTALRNEIAFGGGWRTILPLLGLIPILLILAIVLVRRMMRPLKKMAAELDRRSDSDLRPLDGLELPTEITPFVVAINRLLARVDQAMTAQRRFVADASHELRTPLTALSLQAEGLAEAELSPEAAERLAALRQGLERARNLVAQLLALARARDGARGDAGPVELPGIVREVLEDLWPLAEAKGVDLGAVGEMEGWVTASEVDLRTLVQNLIDNAVRYTPAGGRVDVSARIGPGGPVLEVADTGPGIPPEERARIFEPFHRVLGSDEIGSGLGLAIVAAVSARLGAGVSLDYTNGRTGLLVRVTFTKKPPSA